MHNRASGSSALARAVGSERLLLGFPGAGGWLDGATVRYRLTPEQPTTLGEPDGRLSPRLRQIAKIFEDAGFEVSLSRRMDDWLKTHAMLVTAIAGAIYLAGGSTAAVAKSPESLRNLIAGIRQGFRLLSAAGVVIAPWKLTLIVALPAVFSQIYMRWFLARPASELIMARHANAVPGEMLKLVAELRALVELEPDKASELAALWDAVSSQTGRSMSLAGQAI